MTEADLLRKLEEHEMSGVPLIVEDWHKHQHWPGDLFNLDWLLEHYGDHSKSFITVLVTCSFRFTIEWQVRDVRTCTDTDVTLGEFIRWSRARVSSGVSKCKCMIAYYLSSA